MSQQQTEEETTLVTLNVGGKLFTTTKKTLTQKLYGNQPRHKLQAMVEGRGSVVRDIDGNIFLDRNGKLFRHILDYLRNQGDLSKCVFPVNDPVLLLSIIIEAEYYQLPNIVEYFKGRKQIFDSFGLNENMALMDEGKAFCGVGVVKCMFSCVNNPGVWTPTVAAQMNLLHVTIRPLYGDQETASSGNMFVIGLIGKRRLDQLKMHGMGLAQKDLLFRVESTIYNPKRSLLNSVQSGNLTNLTKSKDEPNELRVYFDLAKKSIYRYNADTKEWKRVHAEMELPPTEEWYFACYCNNNKVMVQIIPHFEDTVPVTE
jgi:hypothetical protein